jgi:hypothetical protein
MTPNGRGPPQSPLSRKIVELFLNGHQRSAIARLVERTPQQVSIVLRRDGLDPKAAAGERGRSADLAFCEAWRQAKSAAEVGRRFGRLAPWAAHRASALRRKGYKLPRRSGDGPPRNAKRAAVEALRVQGLTALEVIAKGVANRGVVYRVFQQHKPAGSMAGRDWTATEDGLLDKLTDAEVAARTGRTVEAVELHRGILHRKTRAAGRTDMPPMNCELTGTGVGRPRRK